MTDGIGGWWRDYNLAVGAMYQAESGMFDGNPVISWTGNIAGLATIIASFAGWIPVFAAGVALIWYAVQLFESKTYQRWRQSRHLRKLLRAKLRVITMEQVLGHDQAVDKSFWLEMRAKSQSMLDEIETHIELH